MGLGGEIFSLIGVIPACESVPMPKVDGTADRAAPAETGASSVSSSCEIQSFNTGLDTKKKIGICNWWGYMTLIIL